VNSASGSSWTPPRVPARSPSLKATLLRQCTIPMTFICPLGSGVGIEFRARDAALEWPSSTCRVTYRDGQHLTISRGLYPRMCCIRVEGVMDTVQTIPPFTRKLSHLANSLLDAPVVASTHRVLSYGSS